MGKRAVIAIGMAAGALWAVGVIFVGLLVEPEMNLTLAEAVIFALMPGGVVLLSLIARLAQRRFFDDTIIDGQPFAKNSGAAIDQAVLSNTVEQLVLCACLWPMIGYALSPSIVFFLGLSFGFTRVLFWRGYHVSPPLRGFGFAAGFYPTVLAIAMALVVEFAT